MGSRKYISAERGHNKIGNRLDNWFDLAEQQQWSETAQLIVLEQFIVSRRLERHLTEFATNIAKNLESK